MSALLTEEEKSKEFLLAFSGGPDSVYLLDRLADFYQDELCKHVTLCYINYHDSPYVDEEERIVLDSAKRYKVNLIKDDVHYLKERDGNFEEWAREYRYKLFAKICENEKYAAVLTAHQKSDEKETYYLQLARHNQPLHYGLNRVTRIFSVKVIRPILDVTKSQIIAYLKENKIPFYDDITNKDPSKMRNRLRMTCSELDVSISQIEEMNKNLELLYNFFGKNKDGMTFAQYFLLTEEKRKRYCFFLIDRVARLDNREGKAKDLFEFLKKADYGKMEIIPGICVYRTKDSFFLSKDLDKLSYSLLCLKPGVYENEFVKVDLTSPDDFNIKAFPVLIRNRRAGDMISTSFPIKDVDTFVKKEGVNAIFSSLYPVFTFEERVFYVPMYCKIKRKELKMVLKYMRGITL